MGNRTLKHSAGTFSVLSLQAGLITGQTRQATSLFWLRTTSVKLQQGRNFSGGRRNLQVLLPSRLDFLPAYQGIDATPMVTASLCYLLLLGTPKQNIIPSSSVGASCIHTSQTAQIISTKNTCFHKNSFSPTVWPPQ